SRVIRGVRGGSLDELAAFRCTAARPDHRPDDSRVVHSRVDQRGVIAGAALCACEPDVGDAIGVAGNVVQLIVNRTQLCFTLLLITLAAGDSARRYSAPPQSSRGIR